MPGTRIPFDGLWRCLCPSVDANALARILNAPLKSNTATRPRASPKRTACAAVNIGRRPVHSRCFDGDTTIKAPETFKSPSQVISRARDQPDPETTRRRLIRAIPPYDMVLDSASEKTIYAALQELRGGQKQRAKVEAFVKYLLNDRGERLTAQIFDSLIQSGAHRDASARELWLLFEWMEACGVGETSGMYHGALKALAVHPDYMLRNKILRDMKSKWLDVDPQGRAYEAIGLLRDGQYELALDAIEAMAHSDPVVPNFVFDTFTLAFCQLGFLDEALKITAYRALKDDSRVSLNIWHFLLDWCSRQLHHEGTKYVWNRAVRTRLLNPSDAMCANVLDTAARAHDIELATAAVQHMASRGGKLNTSHFEALIECYSSAEDVTNAIQTLCLMREAGIVIAAGSTRSLFTTLKNSPNLIELAVAAMFALRPKFDIPLPALNVVIEAMLAIGDVNAGFDLYRHVRALCADPPDATTFRMLFRAARNDQDFVFLDREMRAFGVVAGKSAPASTTAYEPDVRVRRVLLDAHVMHGDLHIALDYLVALTEAGYFSAKNKKWISRETAVTLLRRCFEERPDPVPWLLAQAKKYGCSLDKEAEELVRRADEEDARKAEGRFATGSG